MSTIYALHSIFFLNPWKFLFIIEQLKIIWIGIDKIIATNHAMLCLIKYCYSAH